MKTFAALPVALLLAVVVAEPIPVYDANMANPDDNCTSSSTYLVDPVTASPQPSIPAYGQAPPASNPAPVYTPKGYGGPPGYGGKPPGYGPPSLPVTTYTATLVNSTSSGSTLGSPVTGGGNSTSPAGTAPSSGFTPSFSSATRRGSYSSSTSTPPVTESSSTLTTTVTIPIVSTITLGTGTGSIPSVSYNASYPASPFPTGTGGSTEGSPITGTASSGLPTYANSTSTIDSTTTVSLTETIWLTSTRNSSSSTLSGSAPVSPITATSNSSSVVISTISTRSAPYPYPSYGTGSSYAPSSGFPTGSGAPSSGFSISPITPSSSSGYLPPTNAPHPPSYGLPAFSSSFSTSTGYNSTIADPVGGTRTSSTATPSASFLLSSQSRFPGTGFSSISSTSTASPSSGFSTITTPTAGPVAPPGYGKPTTSVHAGPSSYPVYGGGPPSYGGAGKGGWFGGWFGGGGRGGHGW